MPDIATLDGTAIANIATIDGVAKSSLASFMGLTIPGGGGLTSIISAIHHFEVTIAASSATGTATIPTVDTSRTSIIWNGCYPGSAGTFSGRIRLASCTLTNPTTITATRGSSSTSFTHILRGVAIEWAADAVDSVQYGSVTLGSGVTTNTATISSVDTSRTALFWLGQNTTNNSGSWNIFATNVVLTNGTTVTSNRLTGTNSVTTEFVAVEFASGILTSLQHVDVPIALGNTTQNTTISSVTTGNTLLGYGGWIPSASTVNEINQGYIYLSSAAAITGTRSGSGITATWRICAIEFDGAYVASKSANQTNFAGASATVAQTVDKDYSVVSWLHFTTNGDFTSDQFLAAVELTNDTTLTYNRAGTSSDVTYSSEVMEFVP